MVIEKYGTHGRTAPYQENRMAAYRVEKKTVGRTLLIATFSAAK
jgi:hypothetical protein